eukprot:COSAG04_NODE_3144_length_3124_cov_1.867107_2_plen_217_part_00
MERLEAARIFVRGTFSPLSARSPVARPRRRDRRDRRVETRPSVPHSAGGFLGRIFPSSPKRFGIVDFAAAPAAATKMHFYDFANGRARRAPRLPRPLDRRVSAWVAWRQPLRPGRRQSSKRKNGRNFPLLDPALESALKKRATKNSYASRHFCGRRDPSLEASRSHGQCQPSRGANAAQRRTQRAITVPCLSEMLLVPSWRSWTRAGTSWLSGRRR